MTKKYFRTEERNNKFKEAGIKYLNGEISYEDLNNECLNLLKEQDLETIEWMESIIEELDR